MQDKKHIKSELKQKINELSEQVETNAEVMMPMQLTIDDVLLTKATGQDFEKKDV